MRAVTVWFRSHPIVVFVVVFSALNIAGWRSLEAERHDRCVNGRRDTQAAIVVAVETAAPNNPQMSRDVSAAVAEALPVGEC